MFTRNFIALALTALLSINIVSGDFVKFNVNNEMCCSGTVVAKLSGTVQGCCGTTAFNSSAASLCCNGTVFPLPENTDDRWACCYHKAQSEVNIYNRRTHQCCDGTVLEKPEAGGMFECCTGKLYSLATHRCCSNEVVQLPPGKECCASQETYDTSAQTCCRLRTWATRGLAVTPYKLHPRDDDQKCCGLEVYDPNSQFCCNGTVLPLPNGISSNQTGRRMCCGMQLVTNPRLELCFKGEVWKRNGTNYLVCGDQLFDRKTQFCCGNQILEKSSGLRCCWSADLPFDPKTQVCCGKSVDPITEEEITRGTTACCGGRNTLIMTQS